jgi:hypothetical protein
MLPLETKQPGGKLLPHSDLGGGGGFLEEVSRSLNEDEIRTNINYNIIGIAQLLGHAVTQLVEAPRYNPGGRGFDFLWGSLEFFIDLFFSATLWPWDRLSL